MRDKENMKEREIINECGGWDAEYARQRHLEEMPLHVVQAANALVSELVEGGRREIEVPLLAAGAAIGDGDRHFVAVVCGKLWIV